MVRKLKVSNSFSGFSQKVQELEFQNEDLKLEITKRGEKIKRLEAKIQKMIEENQKLKLELDSNFEKANRTEQKLIEIIEKAKQKNQIISVSELAKLAKITRQQLYKKYKHILKQI